MNPLNIFETLEFNKIKSHLKTYLQTENAENLVAQLGPVTELQTIQQWQNETSEAVAILDQKRVIPIPRIKRLDESINRLKIGASLNGPELARIGLLLSSVHQVVQFFQTLADNDKQFPALEVWVDQCISLPQLVKEINQSLDESGNVLTSASSQLASIRRQQTHNEQQIRSSLNQILKSKANLLTDALITIRNDRYVVPVKAEYRQQIPGTVHDQSSTGQTLYIEPQSVSNLNNKLAELKIAERKEIERILMALSDQLTPYISEISHNQAMICQLDFIQARGRYSQDIEATKPSFSVDQHVAIWQARHPLIDAQIIVANDIIIGDNYRSLIITGPNTGGKTILLKTLGLIQLMGQSGLHIPAESGSQLGIFDQVFADIGDEQSIEQSLSTFSSHMTKIVKILEKMTHNSLILFDELGSGTDPQEGAALAMAILDSIRKVGATVMATTHYPELKLYANEAPDTINASMEFDIDTLSPTYRLLIGIPGRSNALEISRRLGLDPQIIEQARKGISRDDQSLNEMVANLERARRQAEQASIKAEDHLDQAEQLHKDLRTEYNRWLEEKDKLVERTKREANEKIAERISEAENIIGEIRDLQLAQGQKQIIKEHVLIDKKSSLNDLKLPENLQKNKILKKAKKERQFAVGDEVEVQSYGQRGTIVEVVDQNEMVVQMGILKMKIDQKDLKLINETPRQKKVNVHRNVSSKVQTSLDIRGERFDAGINRLKQYLDQALLSNHPMVTIIHGKGTGALRKGVMETLNKHPQVDRFEFSPPNAGGDGSTIVYFK